MNLGSSGWVIDMPRCQIENLRQGASDEIVPIFFVYEHCTVQRESRNNKRLINQDQARMNSSNIVHRVGKKTNAIRRRVARSVCARSM